MYARLLLALLLLTSLLVARAYLTEPSLSPDGHEIAFVAGGDIWTVPSTGGEARLLVSHPANESKPLYSPDGRKLAFISTRTGGSTQHSETAIARVADRAGHESALSFGRGRLHRRLSRDEARQSRGRAYGWVDYLHQFAAVGGWFNGARAICTDYFDGQEGYGEGTPRPVDMYVLRPIGESETGHDVQLEAAVRELLKP